MSKLCVRVEELELSYLLSKTRMDGTPLRTPNPKSGKRYDPIRGKCNYHPYSVVNLELVFVACLKCVKLKRCSLAQNVVWSKESHLQERVSLFVKNAV